MDAISNIHKQEGMHKSLLWKFAVDGKIFGWTPEQLGWNLHPETGIAL